MPLATPRLATPRPVARIELGDLIAVAYEEARSLTSSDEEAVRLASIAISELLASTQNDAAIRDLAGIAADDRDAN